MKGIVLFLLLLFTSFAPADQGRIVAIGDVHGDFGSFQTILKAAGLIDGNGNWSGENTIFVQLGDMLDRGSKGKQSLDLLMQLEKQAPKKGGRVYPLLGNHEVLNIIGDLRYVTPEEFSNFATSESPKRLRETYQQFTKFQLDKASRRKQPQTQLTPQTEEDWMKNHPPGFLEHRDAYGPNGAYGKWLRRNAAVVELQNNVFLHGGLSPKIATMTIREINDRVHQELQLFDRCKEEMVQQKIILPFFTLDEMIDAAKEELQLREKDQMLETLLGLAGWIIINPEGPLWFRGYANWSDAELATSLPPLLETYKTARFIVGHTVQQDGAIHSRQNNAVIMIDTGMNQAFYPNGKASALEVYGGKLTAIYPGARQELK
jgi:Calcineurin-like phosphoesterase